MVGMRLCLDRHPDFRSRAETIGRRLSVWLDAFMLGAPGRREAMKSVRGCLGKAELDLHSLIWTRGAAFPLASLERYPPIRS
jgi:hypothetical protein